MTVGELIEILQKHPTDTRVVAGALECWGDPALTLRVMAQADRLNDGSPDDTDETFVALAIGGEDEMFDDQGPA